METNLVFLQYWFCNYKDIQPKVLDPRYLHDKNSVVFESSD